MGCNQIVQGPRHAPPSLKLGKASVLQDEYRITKVIDAVTVPVMAAGGINDRRGVRAAFALGAEGAYTGTRFIATQKCPAAEIVKNKIVSASYDDMEFVSSLQRSIRTKTASLLAALHADKSNGLDLDREISRLGGLRPAMLDGNMDEGIISVNTGIDLITSIPTVEDLIRQLLGLED